MKDIQAYIQQYQDEFLQDLAQLVCIPSIRDLASRKDGAPFGTAIQEAMNTFKEIAERCGFQVEEDQGYAIHAQIGDQKDYIGVLGHLDVVEILDNNAWNSDPFQMIQQNGYLYGRGVNDDKGPLLAALYAARIVKDLNIPLKYAIRILAGGAEETTWECMDHYFQTHTQPICGFSPDGNFPIVNGEKGIACFSCLFDGTSQELEIQCENRVNWVNDAVEIRLMKKRKEAVKSYAKHASDIRQDGEDVLLSYIGKRAMSRNPQRGENALFAFFDDFYHYPFQSEADQNLVCLFHECLNHDFYGKKAGLYYEDEAMGTTSVCPCSVTWNSEIRELYLDIRYVKSVTLEILASRMEELGVLYGFFPVLDRQKRLLYVKEDSHLIQCLKQAYETVMKEPAELFTKGGASYARVLDEGVAFGATFEGEDPKPHMPNENICLNSLWKAMHIYVESLIRLARE